MSSCINCHKPIKPGFDICSKKCVKALQDAGKISKAVGSKD